jgi:hypothetical protein
MLTEMWAFLFSKDFLCIINLQLPKSIIMDDLTCKQYVDIIQSLNIESTSRNALYDLINYSSISNSLLDTKLVMNTGNSEYNIVSEVFRHLGQDIQPFLAYKIWKNKFMAVAHNRIGETHGYEKNLLFTKIFNIFTDSPYLKLSEKENQNYFISIFKKSVDLKSRNEEQSVVHVLHSLFRKRESLPKEFFKELFAIYVENIQTDSKYQSRIKEIKDWAVNEDFSELSKKYKNIRSYFNTDLSEKICEASVKRYDLNDIAAKTKTKLVWIEENFNAINKFLFDKLVGNTNIHNFMYVNEKIFHKIVVVYEKRDPVVEAVISMHDIFFSMIKSTKAREDELISELWEKLVLKSEIETEFKKDDKKNPKTHSPVKVQKL